MIDLSRRTVIGSISTIVGASISGCIENNDNEINPTNINMFCSKNCDIIEEVNVELSTRISLEPRYTYFIIKLKESVSHIKLSIEIYDDGEIIDIMDVEIYNTFNMRIEFDKYVTDTLENVNIIVHEWEIF